MEVFNQNKTYNFMSKKGIFVGISLSFIIASFILLFTKGLNFGIDFTGGTVIQVKYDAKVNIDSIREKLQENVLFAKSSITEFGSDSEIVIKIPTTMNSVSTDIGDEAKKILVGTGNFEIRRVDMVGPKVGDELRQKGTMAMLLSFLGILAYVSYRFEWRFALASVLALVHDVSITVGMLVLFGIDINLEILAAILTLIGYSINDTIIVFDRIREKIQEANQYDMNYIINEAVSATLSRTTLTSLTTFFVVLVLFLFGGEILFGFSFALVVGIIVGTYSSIFIASPLLVWFRFDIRDYKNKEAEKLKKKLEKERNRAMYERGVV